MYTCLRISGDDRYEFLQGQLTQDLDRLADSGTLLTAWCNPKGRVFLTGRLVADDDSVRLFMPYASLDSAIARLSMYRLRANVAFEVDPAQQALAFPSSLVIDCLSAAGRSLPQGLLRSTDVDGVWLVVLSDVVEAYGALPALKAFGLDAGRALDEASWRQARIRAGCPDIGPENTERFTPHMLNLDKLGALSFDKGCYTGQEVVARTEHLGKVKRRLQRYRIAGASPAVGDKLSLNGADVGEIVSVTGDLALAVVNIDHHAEILIIGNGDATPLGQTGG